MAIPKTVDKMEYSDIADMFHKFGNMKHYKKGVKSFYSIQHDKMYRSCDQKYMKSTSLMVA